VEGFIEGNVLGDAVGCVEGVDVGVSLGIFEGKLIEGPRDGFVDGLDMEGLKDGREEG